LTFVSEGVRIVLTDDGILSFMAVGVDALSIMRPLFIILLNFDICFKKSIIKKVRLPKLDD
jgi:hypothetical protein